MKIDSRSSKHPVRSEERVSQGDAQASKAVSTKPLAKDSAATAPRDELSRVSSTPEQKRANRVFLGRAKKPGTPDLVAQRCKREPEPSVSWENHFGRPIVYKDGLGDIQIATLRGIKQNETGAATLQIEPPGLDFCYPLSPERVVGLAPTIAAEPELDRTRNPQFRSQVDEFCREHPEVLAACPPGEFEALGPSSEAYNCVSHSVSDHETREDLGLAFENAVDFFQRRGFIRLEAPDLSLQEGLEKVVLYGIATDRPDFGDKLKKFRQMIPVRPQDSFMDFDDWLHFASPRPNDHIFLHVAKQHQDGSWSSKLGVGPLVKVKQAEHFCGEAYGDILAVMARPDPES